MKFNLQEQEGTAKSNLDDIKGQSKNIPHKKRSKKSAQFPATLQTKTNIPPPNPVKKLSMA
jgi:hypothetical protein